MATKTLLAAAAALGCAALAGTSAWATSGAPSAGASDAHITQQIEHRLSRDFPNSVYRMRVTTQNGVVTLSGLADTGLAEEQALKDARSVPGVMKVQDRLQVVS